MKKCWLISLLIFAMATANGCGGGSSSSPETVPTIPSSVSEPTVTLVSDAGETSFDESALTDALAALSLGELSDSERDGLLLMREEEKLAGDVYRYLYDRHQLQIFSNIASSEDTHATAVKQLLDRYSLADPAEGNAVGIFTDTDLQMLYDSLTARGTPSLLDGLYVGVLIEELDIFDLSRLRAELDNNPDIALVYESLQKGSRNHLRAFYRQLLDNGGSYTPEYLSQNAFDDIINSELERGPG
ncbi:DUF2202 domain-containing protein [Congregibacter variabilis]|uniref:DUF2202 domain-containing protein n=1 Tax=Congregibacter variabilis TaxID=3081200 RepID=A0ABZ0I6Q6_9GAMM|nr:DUF2202 domain-containing protein [Congregibacter sp. IMCC43200]